MQESTTATPSIPFGFRPTHEELIHHYLYKKVSGEPLPNDDIVKEYDLYGQKDPLEIWEMFGGSGLEEDQEQELYFFTRLKKKSLKDARINRKVGMGWWEAETSPKEIIACGKPMGFWRMFTYKSTSSPQDGRWTMHEYRLVQSLTQSNDYVLCRIKKKKPASEKKRKLQEENLKKLRNLQESGREKKRKPIENHECIESKAEVVLLGVQESRQENGDGIAVGSNDADLVETLFSIDELLNNFEDLDSEEKMSGTKSTMEQPHNYDVLLPLASLPPSTIAADGANKVAENGVNAKEQNSTMPQLTCTSSPSIVPQLPFKVDTTGFIETYAPVEACYGDQHCNEWAKSFAEKLLKNQPPNAMEENEIIMLPNMYFKDIIGQASHAEPCDWQQNPFIYL